jgi:phosphatidylinositol alpha-1,6-mannosyltransferase
MILGLFTELSAAGGVQRAGRLTAAALSQIAAARGDEGVFLSLNDAPGSLPLRVGSQQIVHTGFGRSKVSFVASALRAALRQPKLIVAFHPHLSPIVSTAKRLAPGSRSVVFAHGVEVWMPLPFLRRAALRRSDLVVAPSEYTLQHLITTQGVSPAKVRKLPWSLGPEFTPGTAPCQTHEAKANLPKGRTILTIGRWDAGEAYKGVDHLIMAMPALILAVPDVRLVAIGGGTDLPRLERLSQEQGVASHVQFLAPMAPEALSRAYADAEIFALPSKGEGFGLVFLEAMSHGKPVIGGAHGGTPEVIEEGVSGYLVPYGAVAALRDRLLRLLSDESLRMEMGRRAYERVCSQFTYPRFAGGLNQLLASLLDAPARKGD